MSEPTAHDAPSAAPSLGNAELDRQHELIFERVAEAVAAMDGSRATAEAALGRLADAFVEHFATEEALIDASAFPEGARHRAAHELFHADFRQLQAALAELGPTPELADWVRLRVAEWLRFHILVNDARLADHLARHPLAKGASARAGASRRS
jgi:hemerythrin-like metal-binding protein